MHTKVWIFWIGFSCDNAWMHVFEPKKIDPNGNGLVGFWDEWTKS